MHLGSAASEGGEGAEGASVLQSDGVGFLLHRSFSLGHLGPVFVLLHSGFKCSLPHRDRDSDSIRVSLRVRSSLLLASCEFRKRAWLCSPLPVVLQDPADAGGRISFLLVSAVCLKDERQGKGQETFPRGQVVQPSCEDRRIFQAGNFWEFLSPGAMQSSPSCDVGTPFLTASLLVFPNDLSTLDQ